MVIGNNVWIGDGAIILSGVVIGNGAVIGAGSVITRDIPAWTIAAGVPGRVLRRRFSADICRQLDEVRWWDWPHQRMKRNSAFFETDLVSNPDINLYTLICQ